MLYVYLAVGASVALSSCQLKSFVIENDPLSKEQKTKDETKEEIGEKIKQALKQLSHIHYQASCTQKQCAQLQSSLLEDGELLIENQAPFKKASRQELKETEKKLSEVCKQLEEVAKSITEAGRVCEKAIERVETASCLSLKKKKE